MRRNGRNGGQDGIALIIVLWVLVLLTVIVGTYSLLARTENLQSRHLHDSTRARYAAEAGVHVAATQMRHPDLEARWFADGRPYGFEYGDATLEVRVRDETGKIDLNAAPEFILTNLFLARGLDQDQALQLTDAILDWRDADDEPRLFGAEIDAYEAADYPYGPANSPFSTVEELQQVLGMSHELYRQVEPTVTVFSGRGTPNPAFADHLVLQSLYEIDRGVAEEFILQREQMEPGSSQPLLLPNGDQAVARSNGLTYSIRSRATLPNGAWTEIQATIRLGTDYTGKPFRVVRWRERLFEDTPARPQGQET